MDDHIINQKISSFMSSTVEECINSPIFVGLDPAQKDLKQKELSLYLEDTIIKTLIDNLNEEQMNQLDSLDPQTEEFQNKLAEISSEIPGIADKIQENLALASQTVKNQGVIPTL